MPKADRKKTFLTLIVLGGEQNTSCDAKFCEKCPCSHNNNTALIKKNFPAMTNT